MKTRLPTNNIATKQIFTKVESLEVDSPVALGAAAELLSQANILLDQVVAYKEKKTVPLNQALKAIRAETKPFELVLEKAIDTLRKKMTTYQTNLLKLQTQKENNILKQVEQGTLDPEQAVNQLSTVRDTPDSIQADSGSIKFKPFETFKIMDITMLPIEAILPNEVYIRAKLKEGIRLPGVKYTVEQRPTNFRG